MFTGLLLSLFTIQASAAALPQEPGPLEISAEIGSFVDQNVDRSLPQMERLHALDRALFQDATLGFKYAPETRTAIETFATRSGNCLSFTFLFIAMARHAGLDARFREVEIAPVFSKNGMFVSLNKHVNAAVFIGGAGYVIDVFPGVNRIEIGGEVVDDARGLAHFYNNMGADELGKGNLESAESYLQRAMAVDPKCISPMINLGVVKIQAGQYKEAERYYRKALELDRRNLVAMTNLAVVCERTGRGKEAVRYLAKVRQFQEKNPFHHYNLGMQAYEAGRYQESITYYRKALKLKPMEHHFHFALARSYAKLSRFEEMVSNLQQALKYASDPMNRQRYSEKLAALTAGRSVS